MEQKALSRWMKVILIGVGVCGLVGAFVILPSFGQSLVADYPEFSGRYRPWLLFLLASGLPCYAALLFGWKIASNIGADKSFTNDNARYLKWISWLAAGDSVFFFGGNVILMLANMSHPSVALLSLLVVFAGVAATVASAALSHLVQKAAVLQEQSDLTI